MSGDYRDDPEFKAMPATGRALLHAAYFIGSFIGSCLYRFDRLRNWWNEPATKRVYIVTLVSCLVAVVLLKLYAEFILG